MKYLQVFPCSSGLGELRVEVYVDKSGFDITAVDDLGKDYRIILDRPAAKAITNQLQEYLDETSESTPA